MNIVQMIKAYGGLVLGKTDYWHPDMNVNPALDKDTLGKYPVDMASKAAYPGEYDQQQIPLVMIDGQLSYLPVTIAQYALGNYDRYLDTAQSLYLENAIRCADWFVAELKETKLGLWGWLNDHDKAIYALKKPWFSALSQGQALSVLARAYQQTGGEKYRETALKALQAFTVPVQDGGLVAKLGGGDFYEEYPSEIPSFVLNGFIFALWGLWDLYLVSQNTEARERYETGVATLKNHLANYRIDWLHWSRYDLYPFRVTDITSIFYHKLHIQQLKAMALLTGDQSLAIEAQVYERGKDNAVLRQLATGYKILHKLSIRQQSTYVPSIK